MPRILAVLLILASISSTATAQERRKVFAQFHDVSGDALGVAGSSAGTVVLMASEGQLVSQTVLLTPDDARDFRHRIDSVSQIPVRVGPNEAVTLTLGDDGRLLGKYVMGLEDSFLVYERHVTRNDVHEHRFVLGRNSSPIRVTFALTRRQFVPFLRALDSAATWSAPYAKARANSLSTGSIEEADFSGAAPMASAQSYFELQLEKTASLEVGSPQPLYPNVLRVTRPRGEVLAQFVVDTAGRYEQGTFRVLEADYPEFAEAVRNALPIMRFLPAEIGGRRVKQIVRMPFTFHPPK